MANEEVQVGSENVFEDLEYPNPQERLAKSEIVKEINDIIAKQGWSQSKAASVLGIPQPKVSLLSKGIVAGFSLWKLLTLLNKLNQDVDIVVHGKPACEQRNHPCRYGHIRVVRA